MFNNAIPVEKPKATTFLLNIKINSTERQTFVRLITIFGVVFPRHKLHHCRTTPISSNIIPDSSRGTSTPPFCGCRFTREKVPVIFPLSGTFSLPHLRTFTMSSQQFSICMMHADDANGGTLFCSLLCLFSASLSMAFIVQQPANCLFFPLFSSFSFSFCEAPSFPWLTSSH